MRWTASSVDCVLDAFVFARFPGYGPLADQSVRGVVRLVTNDGEKRTTLARRVVWEGCGMHASRKQEQEASIPHQTPKHKTQCGLALHFLTVSSFHKVDTLSTPSTISIFCTACTLFLYILRLSCSEILHENGADTSLNIQRRIDVKRAPPFHLTGLLYRSKVFIPISTSALHSVSTQKPFHCSSPFNYKFVGGRTPLATRKYSFTANYSYGRLYTSGPENLEYDENGN